MKKVKIRIKDIEKLIFQLKEDGRTGDEIYLLDIVSHDSNQINNFKEDLKKIYNEEKNKFADAKIHAAKPSIINEFKLGDEYKNLEKKQTEINFLQGKLNTNKQNIINEFKLGDEYKNLEKKQTEINSLQDKIKNIDEKNKLKLILYKTK